MTEHWRHRSRRRAVQQIGFVLSGGMVCSCVRLTKAAAEPAKGAKTHGRSEIIPARAPTPAKRNDSTVRRGDGVGRPLPVVGLTLQFGRRRIHLEW